MRSLAYALLLGLVGAGIVHISILFLIPGLSDRDSWARLSTLAGDFRVVRISADAGATPPVDAADPLFEAAACRFDLTESVAHLTASGAVPYWSVSVYDRGGRSLYSFNDRNAVAKSLDLVVATPAQMIELRKTLPAEFENSVFVEADMARGFVVIRAFAPDESLRQRALDYLGSTSCQPA